MKNSLYVGLFVLLVSLSSAAHAAVVGIGDFTPNGGGVYDMTTGSGSVNDTGIESFIGLAPGTLDAMQPTNARHGSALMDTITISTGSISNFDWGWTRSENSNSFFNDFAFTNLSITKVEHIAGTHITDGTTGSISWTATTSGMFTFCIEALEACDNYLSSLLNLNNTTMLLISVGVMGLIGVFPRDNKVY